MKYANDDNFSAWTAIIPPHDSALSGTVPTALLIAESRIPAVGLASRSQLTAYSSVGSARTSSIIGVITRRRGTVVRVDRNANPAPISVAIVVLLAE